MQAQYRQMENTITLTAVCRHDTPGTSGRKGVPLHCVSC